MDVSETTEAPENSHAAGSTAQLKRIYTKARSVGNQQEELEAIVQQESCDRVAITETWRDDSRSWSAAMDGYQPFRRERQGRRGGGVAPYIRERFDCPELNDGDDRVECLWVRIGGKASEADVMVSAGTQHSGEESVQEVPEGVEEETFLTQPSRTGGRRDGWRPSWVRPSQNDRAFDSWRSTEGVSRTATLDFQRAGLGLCRRLPTEPLGKGAVPRGKGARHGWTSFNIKETVKAQEQAVPTCRKTSRRGGPPAWLHRGFGWNAGEKGRVYDLWQKGQGTREGYKGVVRVRRERIRRAKAQLELDLAAAITDNTKCFYAYISNKRRAKENLHRLWDVGGNAVTKAEEEAESDQLFSGYPAPELEDGDGEQNAAPIIQGEIVRDLLHHLGTHRSMGLDGIHPRVLRELAEVLTKPLPILYQQSWLTGEVPGDWRSANVTPVYRKG
ncbi:hypothetical protein QYF61_016972 [Mycteria americana]|uniref:Rna-directed dna polymerase from mobile element jockey-like n=1 Tax=Mycteria americana TaxID=33587 RepID=A0AAN7RNC2_MYCAM|nr:hypothetical protein QYF61_016972 [Mycteria americana]